MKPLPFIVIVALVVITAVVATRWYSLPKQAPLVQSLWQGAPSSAAASDTIAKEPWLFLDTGGVGSSTAWGGGRGEIADVSFLNTRTGVVIGNSGALRTDDGGLTWHQLPISGPTVGWYGVRMVSDQEIWALGQIHPGGLGQVRLTHSMDGGLTWTDQLTDKLDCAIRLHFPNATERWAVGRTTTFRSIDAGATWNRINWGTPFISSDVQVVADAPNSIATYAVGSLPNVNSGTILKSEDGGATWRSLPLPAATPSLTRVYFLDTREGWIAGNQGAVLHTRDGGETWESRPLPFPQQVTALVFQQGGRGWAAAGITFNLGKYAFDWTLFSTRDSGRTWQPQISQPKHVSALASFGPGKVWAVGGIRTNVPNDLVCILDQDAQK